MSRRGAVRAILVPLVVVAVWSPLPAQAADEIGLSRDGITWVDELSVPLFEPERRWVPGDDETRSFWIRNQGPSGAEMTVETLSPSGDRVLAADIALSARVDAGPWRSLGLQRRSRTLTVEPLRVGRTARVDVRATFDSASINRTQRLTLPLTLRITLAQALTDQGDEPDPDPGGLLPGTGATLGWQTLLLGLVLTLGGALLIVRRALGTDGSVRRTP